MQFATIKPTICFSQIFNPIALRMAKTLRVLAVLSAKGLKEKVGTICDFLFSSRQMNEFASFL